MDPLEPRAPSRSIIMILVGVVEALQWRDVDISNDVTRAMYLSGCRWNVKVHPYLCT